MPPRRRCPTAAAGWSAGRPRAATPTRSVRRTRCRSGTRRSRRTSRSWPRGRHDAVACRAGGITRRPARAPQDDEEPGHDEYRRGEAHPAPCAYQHLPADDPLGTRARRAPHQPRLGRLAAEGERRQRLGAEVDREDLQHGEWQRDRAAGQGEDEERDDLGDGVGEDVDDELPDVVIDPASRLARDVAKLSSVSTIVAASRATSVPLRPIAMPMSARRSAGASFTPSPVIAMISPFARSATSTFRRLAQVRRRRRTVTSPLGA